MGASARHVVRKVQENNIAARGQPSGVESEDEEPTTKILKDLSS